MNSGTVFAENDGFTSMTKGTRMTLAVAEKRETKVVVERRVDRRRRVNHEECVPVLRRLHAASVAMLVPAPGRFSTTKGWVRRSESCWPIRRATTSAVPPGG